MMTDLLLSIAHHLLAFGLVAVAGMEWVLLRDPPDQRTVQRLSVIDRIFDGLAVSLLTVGFARAFWGVKGWEFLAHNPFFHLKLTLFALVSLISILPTVRFIQWRRAAAQPGWVVPPDQWRAVRRCLAVEFHLLLLLPIFALLMARGIGLH